MDSIIYEKLDDIVVITINRPAKMNDSDDSSRVAVITGAGKQSFCAGADLKTYTMSFATRPAPEFRRRFTNGPGFGGITRGLNIDKPVVAAINGYAISGGFELALAADIRFCSANAEFALQDVGWGFHACDGGLVRLPQIVGMGHAMEMILS
ncbi:MAG: enoyl-CoA hydratase/isomerase family protein, partial [Betaproteobacteria bacterium]|nr:enoyl-CoA hydratase/isomerase family protein [Betaproteobacteria bacterium]